MSAKPGRFVERVVAFFIPPDCREHVLGDLNERYTGIWQYFLDAIRTVPWVIASRIRRTTGLQLFVAEALAVFAAYLAGTWIEGPRMDPFERVCTVSRSGTDHARRARADRGVRALAPTPGTASRSDCGVVRVSVASGTCRRRAWPPLAAARDARRRHPQRACTMGSAVVRARSTADRVSAGAGGTWRLAREDSGFTLGNSTRECGARAQRACSWSTRIAVVDGGDNRRANGWLGDYRRVPVSRLADIPERTGPHRFD